MAVTPADFLTVRGTYLNLDALKTDRDGWITAIAVTLQGIVGGENSRRRNRPTQYRLLASVDNLRTGLPLTWIASPPDRDIDHVNIWPARNVCPFTGTKLPEICWGESPYAWNSLPEAQRTLANFLEAARQVLGHTNFSSRAR